MKSRFTSFLIPVLCVFCSASALGQSEPKSFGERLFFTYLGTYLRYSPDGLVEASRIGLSVDLEDGVFRGSIVLEDGTELLVAGSARLINGQGEGILKVQRAGMPREKFPITFRGLEAFGGALSDVNGEGTVTGFRLKGVFIVPN